MTACDVQQKCACFRFEGCVFDGWRLEYWYALSSNDYGVLSSEDAARLSSHHPMNRARGERSARGCGYLPELLCEDGEDRVSAL